MSRSRARTTSTTSAPSPRASARCWPTATRGPACPPVPTGTPRTCSGTSPASSGSGPDRRAPAAEPPTRPTSRIGPRRTPSCWRPSTVRPRRLVEALEGADPTDEAWTWSARPHRRVHPSPAGARGADPPARRRAGRGQVTRARPAAGRRRGRTRCIGVMYGGVPALGLVGAAPPLRPASTAPTPATSCGSRSACSPAPIPTAARSRRRGGLPRRRRARRHRARRRDRRPGRPPSTPGCGTAGDDSELSIAGDRDGPPRFRGGRAADQLSATDGAGHAELSGSALDGAGAARRRARRRRRGPRRSRPR